MAVYLITYDLKKASGHDYTKLHDEIKSFGTNRWHYLESTWLVETSLTADAMSERIRAIYQPEYHLVYKLTKADKQGWLPKEAWDWINRFLI